MRLLILILSLPIICNATDLEAIHSRAIVLDAHADIEIPGQESRYAGDDGRSQVEPDKMKRGGVDAVVMTIAVGPGPRTPEGLQQAQARANAELAAILGIIAETDSSLVLAETADHIISAHDQGQSALILGLQNARILGDHL